MAPLRYQGREFAAGITGHKGLVVGDKPGKWDNFYMGLGFDGDGKGMDAFIGKTMNVFFDGDWMSNLLGVAQAEAKWAFPKEWELSKDEVANIYKGSVNLDRSETYDSMSKN